MYTHFNEFKTLTVIDFFEQEIYTNAFMYFFYFKCSLNVYFYLTILL